MSNITPGPWEWAGDDNDLIIRPRRIPYEHLDDWSECGWEDDEVSVIAVLPLESYEHLEDWSECGWSAEGEANARLMAAAPEMRARLIADRALLYAIREAHKIPIGDVLEIIDALLRRIEGEEESE